MHENTIQLVCKQLFNKEPLTIQHLGQGFYANAYGVTLLGTVPKAVIKLYKVNGMHQDEATHLNLIRQHSFLTVPKVYDLVSQNDNIACDAMLMEWIDGIDPNTITCYTETEKRYFADTVIDNLLAIHSCTGTHYGFSQSPDATNFQAWLYQHFLESKERMLNFLLSSSPAESHAIQTCLDYIDAHFYNIFPEPSQPHLIHGDYNMWNMLVDETTHKPVAIIDPGRHCFATPETELFQLDNARGKEFDLLASYAKKANLDDDYLTRNAFYYFIDDVYHTGQCGWYDACVYQLHTEKIMSLMSNI